MQRIQSLTRYQKIILAILAFQLAIFTILYPIVTNRKGFAFQDTVLPVRAEEGNTLYSGLVHWKKLTVTVTPDRTVTFHYKDRTYGPYTAKEDPSAIPEDHDLNNITLTGVEICEKDNIFFRGGVWGKADADLYLLSEDGHILYEGISYMTNSGMVYGQNGEAFDSLAPSPADILQLMHGPELTGCGDGRLWFGGTALALLFADSILFADEIFRRNASFLVRNPEDAEPSEWEMGKRYILWTVAPVFTLIVYIIGIL